VQPGFPRAPVHAAAEAGYTRQAGAYVRGRPDYPAASVAWLSERLGIAPGRRVLEVASGTGKLSEALLGRVEAPDLVAVEPVAAMRARFAERFPTVALREGRAEALPLEDASVAAVVVGQAFHWFDAPAAIAEIHRVLCPGGGLGLIWNVRDEAVDWVAAFGAIVNAYVGDAPTYGSGAWRAAFAETDLFGPLDGCSFPHAQRADPETLVDRAASVSYVAALPEDEHRAVRSAIRRLLAEHSQTRGRALIELPYRTEAFVCSRRERAA
jgi:SAM-dependent methyltransferase